MKTHYKLKEKKVNAFYSTVQMTNTLLTIDYNLTKSNPVV